MEYQREKDHKIYENAVVANENARLSILKQGEMVNCSAHLSTVLGKSLNTSSGFAFPSTPQTTTREGRSFSIQHSSAPPMTAFTGAASFPKDCCGQPHNINFNAPPQDNHGEHETPTMGNTQTIQPSNETTTPHP